MEILVAGSHGFIGTALLARLRDAGHDVRVLVRRPASGPAEVSWDPARGRLDPAALAGVDAVVDLAGTNPGTRPLTAARKRDVVASRVDTAGLLARTIAGLDGPRPALLQASGIGAYGDRGETEVDEREPLGTTFFAEVVRQWEEATAPAREAGARVVLLRTGVVLGRGGGALRPLWPVLRAGLGGRLGSGRQFWPWITLHDEVRAIEHLLTADVAGPVNLVTHADRNADVVAALAGALGRPAVVPVPAFALRLALRDFASEVLGSVRAVPAVLDASGFVPEHADLETAARWTAGSA
ncbi:TIGR01777 family oxidoreductase [Cellulomonas sp. PSBB021]|uniref:TIGR01777 family oxidoreductase n=1 Tax=Cellulomonas sp. PSBB021 TaxID=2003551 RepID=UPI000B8D2C5A|nr:TIGR01777 family oxidoreductase [Cellulomonas sp. PSBB021]ASR54768.1 TIGR01777 family protein [Cellulomonas sp. PSBB021]